MTAAGGHGQQGAKLLLSQLRFCKTGDSQPGLLCGACHHVPQLGRHFVIGRRVDPLPGLQCSLADHMRGRYEPGQGFRNIRRHPQGDLLQWCFPGIFFVSVEDVVGQQGPLQNGLDGCSWLEPERSFQGHGDHQTVAFGLHGRLDRPAGKTAQGFRRYFFLRSQAHADAARYPGSLRVVEDNLLFALSGKFIQSGGALNQLQHQRVVMHRAVLAYRYGQHLHFGFFQ